MPQTDSRPRVVSSLGGHSPASLQQAEDCQHVRLHVHPVGIKVYGAVGGYSLITYITHTYICYVSYANIYIYMCRFKTCVCVYRVARSFVKAVTIQCAWNVKLQRLEGLVPLMRKTGTTKANFRNPLSARRVSR